MRPQIFVTRQLPDPVLKRLGEVCDYRVGAVAGALDRAALLEGARNADGLICLLTDTIDAELITSAPRLKVIANVAVGYNNIDLTAARERGIHVTNTPDVLTDATADLTWALILGITRRIVEADAFLRAGRFDGWDFDMLLGTGLTGKTLGIVGYGRIGRAVARRASGFGMSVVYCGRDDIAYRDDPQYNAHQLARQASARAAQTGFLSQSSRTEGTAAKRATFHQLIENSDIITLHVPLATTTRHLINQEVFSRIKPGAYLINTARGPVVDESALADALESGRLAGAGLDVFEHEPAVDPRLPGLSNVILLPHIGSATRETRTAMAMLAAENVIDAVSGKVPRSLVR